MLEGRHNPGDIGQRGQQTGSGQSEELAVGHQLRPHQHGVAGDVDDQAGQPTMVVLYCIVLCGIVLAIVLYCIVLYRGSVAKKGR